MRVEEIMTKDVCPCGPDTNLASAAQIMWTKNCGCIPVVEDDGRVIGIVTDRDLFLALGTNNHRPAEVVLRDFMAKDPVLCDPDSDVRAALQAMAQRQLRRLPVVNQAGQLVGIVSLGDIALRAHDEISMDTLNALRAVCDRRSRHRAAQREAFWAQTVAM